MKNILVLGAGKSATDLISYLLKYSDQYNWTVTVGDYDEAIAQKKVNGHPNGKSLFFDVHDAALRAALIQKSDIVASVLPASFHHLVAKDCLQYGKHIITPSYISPQEKALDAEFKAANLLFMGEIGLDPGIDHMTLMKTLETLKAEGATIEEVRSCTGALIAPESDTNPWHYKFSWAPINVVKAGQGTAQFLKNGKPKYIPYNRLFQIYDTYEVEGYGAYEAYANRDSLLYLDKYKLDNIPTFIRCTLRKQGYCDAWNALVKLGWTDDSYPITNSNQLTYHDLIEAFLPKAAAEDTRPFKVRLAELLQVAVDSEVMKKLEWLGIFDRQIIPINNATPARILLQLLEAKWQLQADDKDMIVMLHQIISEKEGVRRQLTATMIAKGKNADETAISRLVGIPMAIMVKLVLTGKVALNGVHIPIMQSVYEPILAELTDYGVQFTEKETIL